MPVGPTTQMPTTSSTVGPGRPEAATPSRIVPRPLRAPLHLRSSHASSWSPPDSHALHRQERVEDGDRDGRLPGSVRSRHRMLFCQPPTDVSRTAPGKGDEHRGRFSAEPVSGSPALLAPAGDGAPAGKPVAGHRPELDGKPHPRPSSPLGPGRRAALLQPGSVRGRLGVGAGHRGGGRRARGLRLRPALDGGP